MNINSNMILSSKIEKEKHFLTIKSFVQQYFNEEKSKELFKIYVKLLTSFFKSNEEIAIEFDKLTKIDSYKYKKLKLPNLNNFTYVCSKNNNSSSKSEEEEEEEGEEVRNNKRQGKKSRKSKNQSCNYRLVFEKDLIFGNFSFRSFQPHNHPPNDKETDTKTRNIKFSLNQISFFLRGVVCLVKKGNLLHYKHKQIEEIKEYIKNDFKESLNKDEGEEKNKTITQSFNKKISQFVKAFFLKMENMSVDLYSYDLSLTENKSRLYNKLLDVVYCMGASYFKHESLFVLDKIIKNDDIINFSICPESAMMIFLHESHLKLNVLDDIEFYN